MFAFLFAIILQHNAFADDGLASENVELMKTLADPYDDEKVSHLSQLGLKKSEVIKGRSGAMITEKYYNASHTLSATVNRNENSGDVTTIEKTKVSRQGSVIDKWNLSANSYAHTVRHNGKIETANVTTASCNLTTLDGAPKSNVAKDACQLLTQAIAGAFAVAPDSASSSTAPSATKSPATVTPVAPAPTTTSAPPPHSK